MQSLCAAAAQPFLLGAALILGWAAGGCGDALKAYPLSGQYYDAEQDCLGENLVIDVIEGEDPGTCDEEVRCIQSRETGERYLSAICEVPALYEDLTDAGDELCDAAFAAGELGSDGRCEQEPASD